MKKASCFTWWLCVFVGVLQLILPDKLHAQAAPGITTQPGNQTVVAGSNALFSIVATGQTPLSYQWSRNGANLSDGANVVGSTNSALTIVSALPGDVGSYVVVVTNRHGSVTSSTATLTVLVPPAITQQPVSETIGVGTNAVFSAVATGTAPLTNRWLFNGVPLVDDSRITGSTSTNLTIANVAASDGGSYSMAVSNVAGTTTSAAAVLNVGFPPTLTAQPQNQTVLIGSNVTFSAAASGTGVIGYQWLLNEVPIAGATDAMFSIADAQAFHQGSYTVVATNSFGSATSQAAALTVVTTPVTLLNVDLTTYATYAQNRKIGPAAIGQTSQDFWNAYTIDRGFFPAPNVNGLNTYTMLADGSPVSTVVQVYNGTGAAINGTSDPMYNTYVYSTNDSPLRLQIFNVPKGTYDFYVYGHEGSDLAVGTYELAIAGVTYNATNMGPGWYSAAWKEGAQYVAFRNVEMPGIGVAVDIYAPSNAVSRGVIAGLQMAQFSLGAVAPEVWTQAELAPAAVGSTITIPIKVTGTLPMSFQWVKDGVPLTDDARISGSATASLTIANAQTNDGGFYSMIVSNSVGVVSNGFETLVRVQEPPYFVQKPTNDIEPVGSYVTMTSVVGGDSPLSYQWYVSRVGGLGEDYVLDDGRINGAQTSSLTISNAQVNDSGTYYLIVGNQVGYANTSNTLTISVPLVFSQQPVGHSAPLGLWTMFTGSPTGSGPISYQWQFNGTNIAGAITATFAVSNLSLANFGSYNLVASNAVGVAVSSNALLTLGPVACWGRNTERQCLPPAGLTNVVGIVGGADYSASIQSDGSLTSWSSFVKLPSPPVTNAVAIISASADAGEVLRADGTIVGWGTSVPAGISNVTAIAMGGASSLFLRSDRTVGAIPLGSSPAGLTKVVAIAEGGYNQCLALRSDGTVLEWSPLLVAAGTTAITNPVPGLSNVVAIAAGYGQCLALKADGRIVTWGAGDATNVPAILTNASAPRVTAIAAGGSSGNYPQVLAAHSLALLTNGTVIAWGDNFSGQTDVPKGLSNVVAVAAGTSHSLALVSDGRPVMLQSPVGGTAFTGRDYTFQSQVTGNAPLVYQWTFNGTNITDATNATLTVTKLQSANAGTYQLFVSNSIGSASSVPLPLNVMDSAPFLSFQPASQTAYVGTRFVWSVPVNGSGPMQLQWRFSTSPPVGPLVWQDLAGATNEDLVLDPARVSEMGLYSLVASNAFGAVTSSIASLTVRQVVAWGDNSFGQTNVPVYVTNAVAIAANAAGNLALRDDGTVAIWGSAGTNVPIALSNVVEVAEGSQGLHLALKMDGTTTAWNIGGNFSNMVAGLSNIVAMEADVSGGAFLRADGTVARVGLNGVVAVPPGGSNIVAITHDSTGFIGIRADGTVFVFQGVTQPPPTTNILAAAAGMYAGVFLRRDGTIVDWGAGPTNSLSNIIEVAATDNANKMAVRSDGTAVVWTLNTIPPTPPAGLGGVIAADGGSQHFVTLLSTRAFPPVYLSDALDTSALVVSSRSSPQWYGQTRVTHDGKHAARSAQIASSTASSMRMLVTNGPINVSFWWKVSSETNHDFLTLSVGGVPQTAISGEVDWQQVTVTVPAGPQMLVWTYSKDASGTAGLDAGFVDQLTFTPIAPSITSQPLSQTVLGGTAVSMSADVYGTAPLSYEWFEVGSSKPVRFGAVYAINPTARLDSGTFYVVVTNSAGSVTSSNAVLVVHVPQLIHTPIMQQDGTFVITSQDADRRYSYSTNVSGFQAQYSSNLVDWWPVSAPLSLSNAILQFTDTDATNAPVRFYRVIEAW